MNNLLQRFDHVQLWELAVRLLSSCLLLELEVCREGSLEEKLWSGSHEKWPGSVSFSASSLDEATAFHHGTKRTPGPGVRDAEGGSRGTWLSYRPNCPAAPTKWASKEAAIYVRHGSTCPSLLSTKNKMATPLLSSFRPTPQILLENLSCGPP